MNELAAQREPAADLHGHFAAPVMSLIRSLRAQDGQDVRCRAIGANCPPPRSGGATSDNQQARPARTLSISSTNHHQYHKYHQ